MRGIFVRSKLLGAFAALGLMFTAWTAMPIAAFAQEEPAAAAPAAAAPAAAPAGAATPAPEVEERSYLGFLAKALGTKYIIIFLLLSFIFVAYLVMNTLALRRASIVPASLVEGFEALLNEKKFQDAYELAKSDDSYLGRVLAAGMGKLQQGFGAAEGAMQEVSDEEGMRLEHRLSFVALIGTLAPMFGLLGTVDGMVDSFTVIATSPTQPKPSQLAEGISMALVTTLVGLWLAIPAIGYFGAMRNRLAKLTMEAAVLSEGLMSRFAGVGKK
ncbi:MAG: MotA/TolQ/ExbB proton channel family protein [Planctomycetes bacterium]|nr:MotA/TolQ/ExbB proton channel family protein [Planctomycetota bacterium]